MSTQNPMIGIPALPTQQRVTQPERGADGGRNLSGGMLTIVFTQWLGRIFNVCNAVATSGPTADRPDRKKDRFIGMPYFDTELGGGKPIWLKSVTPDVWVDATGAAV